MGIFVPYTESNSVKDLIIKTLASGPPLSIKKLHDSLRKNYSVKVTYQATHKATLSLVIHGTLIRKYHAYTLNPLWVNNLSRFVDGLRKNTMKYSGLVDSVQEGQIKTLTFANYEKAQEFKKELQKEFFVQKQKLPPIYAGEDGHLTSPLIYSEKSLRLLNLVNQTKAKCYILVKGDTIVDKWCANYYRSEHINVRTRIECAKNCDLFVLGNKIIQIYLPKAIQHSLDKMYHKAKKISDIIVPDLYREVYKRKAKVKIVITQNAELADHVRQRIMGYFI